jgi:hypothetical protein
MSEFQNKQLTTFSKAECLERLTDKLKSVRFALGSLFFLNPNEFLLIPQKMTDTSTVVKK